MKAALRVGAVLALALVAIYAAGILFLLMGGLSPTRVRFSTLWDYYWRWGHDRRVRLYLALSVVLVAVPVVLGAVAWLRRDRPLHGAARYATAWEVWRAGFFGDDGLALAKIGTRYLLYPGDNHVLVKAPTGAGKTEGVALPIAFTWKGSLLALDMKRRLFEETSGYRARSQRVFLVDALSPTRTTHRTNPLSYLRFGTDFFTTDVDRIAHLLVPSPKGGTQAPIWAAGARDLFTALVMYQFETPGEPCTIGQAYRLATHPDGVERFFEHVLKERDESGDPLSTGCHHLMTDFIRQGAEQRDGIRKELTTHISLWKDPLIDSVTSADDFDFRQMRREPMTVYVVVTPDNRLVLEPLVKLVFQMALSSNMDVLPKHDATLRFSMCALLDEFPSIGSVPAVRDSMAFIREYGVRVVAIVQTEAQLESLYGKPDTVTFKSNCGAIVELPTRNTPEADTISRELGTQTATGRTEARSRQGTSRSEAPQRRSLALPQEVREMRPHQAIVFNNRTRPILVSAIYASADPTFTRRRCDPVEVDPIAVTHAPSVPSLPKPKLKRTGKRRAAEPAEADVEALADQLMQHMEGRVE